MEKTVREQLVEALERIMQMRATSSLEACAYQGPPPKKWMREVAPALDARYNAVEEAQAIAKPVLLRARAELEWRSQCCGKPPHEASDVSADNPVGFCSMCRENTGFERAEPECGDACGTDCPCYQAGTEAERRPIGA